MRITFIFVATTMMVCLVLVARQAEAGKSNKQLMAFALLSLLNRSKKIVLPIPLPFPLPIPVIDKKHHVIHKEPVPVPVPIYEGPAYHKISIDNGGYGSGGGYGGDAGSDYYVNAVGSGYGSEGGSGASYGGSSAGPNSYSVSTSGGGGGDGEYGGGAYSGSHIGGGGSGY